MRNLNSRTLAPSLAAIVFLAAGIAPVQAGETLLSEDQIIAALSGKTAFGEQKGRTWRQYFDANGSTIFIEEQGEPSPGKWRFDGDLFCSQWPPRAGWDCY